MAPAAIHIQRAMDFRGVQDFRLRRGSRLRLQTTWPRGVVNDFRPEGQSQSRLQATWPEQWGHSCPTSLHVQA